MNLQGMSRRRSQDGLGNIAELNVEYPNVGHLIIDGIYVSTRRESRKARSTEQDSMFWNQLPLLQTNEQLNSHHSQTRETQFWRLKR